MPAPKFAEIKQFIFQKIESGEWQEHHRVPSENELAEQFSVSRMTARRALTELCDDGVLTRTQGLGTFVASFKSQTTVLDIRNIADEIRERGHKYEAVVHQKEQRQATAPIAIALGIKPGDDVDYLVISHLEDDKPIQLEERYVNPLLVNQFLEQDFTQQTPHEFLSQAAPLTEAKHVIEAISPTSKMCEWLELFNEEPCLQIKRRTWSSQGVVSFARLVFPGSRYRLGSHLTFK